MLGRRGGTVAGVVVVVGGLGVAVAVAGFDVAVVKVAEGLGLGLAVVVVGARVAGVDEVAPGSVAEPGAVARDGGEGSVEAGGPPWSGARGATWGTTGEAGRIPAS